MRGLALGVSGQELVKLCVLQGARGSDQAIPLRWRHTSTHSRARDLTCRSASRRRALKRKAQREEGTSNQESECEIQRIVFSFARCVGLYYTHAKRRAISSSAFPALARPDRHRSNIQVSQNPAARDQRGAGVGCERVQSSHGSPAPFCAQVPGRSDAEPSGAERGGYVSTAAAGLRSSQPPLFIPGKRS